MSINSATLRSLMFACWETSLSTSHPWSGLTCPRATSMPIAWSTTAWEATASLSWSTSSSSWKIRSDSEAVVSGSSFPGRGLVVIVPSGWRGFGTVWLTPHRRHSTRCVRAGEGYWGGTAGHGGDAVVSRPDDDGAGAYDATPFLPRGGGLEAYRRAAEGCRGCPL